MSELIILSKLSLNIGILSIKKNLEDYWTPRKILQTSSKIEIYKYLKKYVKRQPEKKEKNFQVRPQKRFFCQVKSNLNRLVHHDSLLIKKRNYDEHISPITWTNRVTITNLKYTDKEILRYQRSWANKLNSRWTRIQLKLKAKQFKFKINIQI